MKNEILKILDYFHKETIDFDVYIIADTQDRTKFMYASSELHANEDEFFSREEFAEIASAIFYVFGYAKVFYSELEFIEYFFDKGLAPYKFIVYNLARDGKINGKKSLIPSFCDLLGIRYTGSNAFTISLLRNKDIYTCLLNENQITVPKSKVYTKGNDCSEIVSLFYNQTVIAKNINESASIGLTEKNIFRVSEDLEETLLELATQLNTDTLMIQEFIEGKEYEVLVLQFAGKYYALNPVEIIFQSGASYIDSASSNAYKYNFQVIDYANASLLCNYACQAATILKIKDYARFDFRVKNGVPYLFDIAGTPYTIQHSSIAYLFTKHYHLPYESIYKVIVACMLSNYKLQD